MFRASTADEGQHTLITIDGHLSGDYVRFLDECYEQASAAGKPVHVFLRDVPVVDEAARQLLHRLAAKGVFLRANGVYNTHLVRECSSAAVRTDKRRGGEKV